MIYYSTVVTAIGEEVSDLLDGGVLILYADGAPPALAEVSVQHRIDAAALTQPPPVGSSIRLGQLNAQISAVGTTAWDKVRELGHVVISFTGATQAARPGEICVEARDGAAVLREIRPGNTIVIAD